MRKLRAFLHKAGANAFAPFAVRRAKEPCGGQP